MAHAAAESQVISTGSLNRNGSNFNSSLTQALLAGSGSGDLVNQSQAFCHPERSTKQQQNSDAESRLVRSPVLAAAAAEAETTAVTASSIIRGQTPRHACNKSEERLTNTTDATAVTVPTESVPIPIRRPQRVHQAPIATPQFGIFAERNQKWNGGRPMHKQSPPLESERQRRRAITVPADLRAGLVEEDDLIPDLDL